MLQESGNGWFKSLKSPWILPLKTESGVFELTAEFVCMCFDFMCYNLSVRPPLRWSCDGCQWKKSGGSHSSAGGRGSQRHWAGMGWHSSQALCWLAVSCPLAGHLSLVNQLSPSDGALVAGEGSPAYRQCPCSPHTSVYSAKCRQRPRPEQEQRAAAWGQRKTRVQLCYTRWGNSMPHDHGFCCAFLVSASHSFQSMINDWHDNLTCLCLHR